METGRQPEWTFKRFLFVISAVLIAVGIIESGNQELEQSSSSKASTSTEKSPKRARDSIYTQRPFDAVTSYGLSKADLAWHATNTYGWPCPEVFVKSVDQGGYFYIICKGGLRLHVYPRVDTYPRITAVNGSY